MCSEYIFAVYYICVNLHAFPHSTLQYDAFMLAIRLWHITPLMQYGTLALGIRLWHITPLECGTLALAIKLWHITP